MALCLGASPAPAQTAAQTAAQIQPHRQAAPPPGLEFAETLYLQQDWFRAEDELLRVELSQPPHPWGAQAQLARAKIAYRLGQWRESRLMALSLLDRYPPGPYTPQALDLLQLSHARLGLPLVGETQPLTGPPPHDGERARVWSTWLPGSGFFVLGQPGRGSLAVGLNLAFIGGAVVALAQANPGAALVMAIVEASFWSGGREAVTQEASRLNRAGQQQKLAGWLAGAGEADLLAQPFAPPR